MQLCNGMLRRGGDVQHVIPMRDMTPAEILVLRTIHGPDAVVDIVPTRMDKRSHPQEWDRLASKYDAQANTFGAKDDDERKSLLERLFPGAMKRLPVTLDEIGLGELMNPNTRPVAQENGNGEDTSGGNPTEGQYYTGETEADPPREAVAADFELPAEAE